MANRRMFSKEITESDAFADMPLTTQALYFHLGMNADDDGFINNAKRIQRSIGASDDDMRLLAARRFIIPFPSGVAVVKHWRINNWIQSDRYTPTKYTDEMSLLTLKENKSYSIDEQAPDLDVYMLDTQYRLGKDRIGKDRSGKETHTAREGGDQQAQKEPKHKHGEFSNVLLTDSELGKLKAKFPNDWQSRIEDLSYYMGSTGKSYKSHYRTILSWERRRSGGGAVDAGQFAMYRD